MEALIKIKIYEVKSIWSCLLLFSRYSSRKISEVIFVMAANAFSRASFISTSKINTELLLWLPSLYSLSDSTSWVFFWCRFNEIKEEKVTRRWYSSAILATHFLYYYTPNNMFIFCSSGISHISDWCFNNPRIFLFG